MSGIAREIQIASVNNEPPSAVQSAELIADKGVVGDSHFGADCSQTMRQLTLIEQAQVDYVNAMLNLGASVRATKRNIVTEGIALNELVGRRFCIGEAVAEGVELCEPCASLGKDLSSESIPAAEIVRAFIGRGGLRARIVNSGIVKVGDAIALIKNGD